MYLDAGMDVARERILALVRALFSGVNLGRPLLKIPKHACKEYQQAQKISLLLYAVIQITGPSNEQVLPCVALYHKRAKSLQHRATAVVMQNKRPLCKCLKYWDWSNKWYSAPVMLPLWGVPMWVNPLY